MPPQSRRRQGDFLKPYRIDSRYLLRPDHKRGRPGILSGENESGDPVIIKEWRRDSAGNDAELREIWHHEIRQLHRLGGYPKASDFIATLQHTGWDDIGFYLVLDPGQRRPLATIIEHGIKSNWLSNPRLPANRSLLWKNLKRVCAGLETLHSQGLLHKNLDNWSILTSSGEEPDFQLTGFEWSIRLVGAATKQSKQKSPNNPTGEPASFLSDWRDFGVLAAELLNVQISHIKDPKIPPSGIADHLLTEESRLLRNLLQIDVLDRLDGEVVEQRISNIIRLLEAEIAARDAKFYLVVRLGTNSDLSKEIRTASGDEIEIDSYREQTEFIMDDLRQNSLLIGVKTETGDGFRLILEGSKLIYQINPYNHSNSSSSNTWEVAYTEECERKFPASVNIISQVELPTNSLEVMTNRDAKKRYGRLRGKLSSWESLRREFISQQPNRDRDAKLHQALALTQFLEALFAVADSFPVEIVSQENREDGSLLMVKARSDADRDSLSVAIGMKPPALRLDDALVKDKRGGDWVLTEAKYLGDRAPTDTLWKFEAKPSAPSGPEHYQFIGTNTPGHLEDPVLIPGDFSGRDIQFQRRLKALRALADHSELLWMLVDPRRRILDTHVPVEANDAFSDLDDSKQQAVKEIIETLPLYLVQGPPGVGKTRMVRELVKDTFENDQTARLLLSAQSNAAVDHLMETVRESFQDNTNDILIVRCRSRDNTREPGPYEIENQLKGVVSRFSESDLVKNSDPALHENVRNLASEIMGEGKSNLIRHSSNRNAKQAIEGLVVRSANIVFATTNSYELERLIDERNQFDWSIIEEAGKATGGELLSPLLLSHRRLMIGDHKQLSPFGSERIIKLLDNPETVLNALKVGQGYISRNLRDPSTDEILDEINDEKSHEIGSICALSLDCLLLFERLIENEFLHQKKKSKTRKIAHQLNEQHRMHPAIARLVSRCFYEDRLNSHPSAIERFRNTTSPIKSDDTKRLPITPITVIDMPYVQNTVGMRKGEEQPRWHNSLEIEAAKNVLELLSSKSNSGTQPSLAILSPYSVQVEKLKLMIEETNSVAEKLKCFRPAIGPNEYCGTVDSFQGNEADIVLVSMVRNNHHSGIRPALGFLSDSRRMNVLISRAKWRLILIYSSEFIRHVLDASQGTESRQEVEFLHRMLEGIEVERKESNAVIIPFDRLIREAKR